MSVLSNEVNMSMVEGDVEPFSIDVNDDNGDPIPIDGWTFEFIVKNDHRDADSEAVFQKTVSNHTVPSDGESYFRIESADTAGEYGNKVYEFNVEMPNGDTHTLMTGTFYIGDGIDD